MKIVHSATKKQHCGSVAGKCCMQAESI